MYNLSWDTGLIDLAGITKNNTEHSQFASSLNFLQGKNY